MLTIHFSSGFKIMDEDSLLQSGFVTLPVIIFGLASIPERLMCWEEDYRSTVVQARGRS
jgi:hypothetical protein